MISFNYMEGIDESRDTSEKINTLLIDRVIEIAGKHGIVGIKAGLVEKGEVVFDIEPPADHSAERSKKLVGNLLNEGIETTFTQKSLMPFVREFIKEYGDYFELKFTKSGDSFQCKVTRKTV